MEGDYKDKYTFVAQWRDVDSGLLRTFNLNYYMMDGTLDLYDLEKKKIFMSRMRVKGVTVNDIYIGACIRILGRMYDIVDFGCENTKTRLGNTSQRTFALIKSLPNDDILGEIIHSILESGFKISRLKMTKISKEELEELYYTKKGDPFLPFIIEFMANQNVVGLELVGDNSIKRWKEAMGDVDPLKADPNSIRGKFGIDNIKNAVHGSENEVVAKHDLSMFFPRTYASTLRLTALLSNCTCCIIKPHAIAEGNMGHIIKAINLGGFKVTAMNMYYLPMKNAAEFLEVYKGVVTEYQGLIEELAEGPCLALEIVSKNPNVATPSAFRKLVGPVDPDVARLIRPNTIRAKFGRNRVQNAVHCSDIPEDGLLEVEYFFKILE